MLFHLLTLSYVFWSSILRVTCFPSFQSSPVLMPSVMSCLLSNGCKTFLKNDPQTHYDSSMYQKYTLNELRDWWLKVWNPIWSFYQLQQFEFAEKHFHRIISTVASTEWTCYLLLAHKTETCMGLHNWKKKKKSEYVVNVQHIIVAGCGKWSSQKNEKWFGARAFTVPWIWTQNITFNCSLNILDPQTTEMEQISIRKTT